MERLNPWWKGREGLEEDEDYRKWVESKVKWVPSLLGDLELKPFSLHFLFGPRQVGKTTLLKLLIRELLDKGVNPKAIFYYRCDTLSDFKELDKILEEYAKIKKREKITTSYVFLDEVTFPKEWFRAIKFRIDLGEVKNDVLLLTGSLSMLAKREVETFPGRRGFGRDYVLHPLSFREFVKVYNPSLHAKLEALDRLSEEEIKIKCFKLAPWKHELNEAFESYLECGGFPLAVKSFLERGKVSEEAKSAYLSAFLFDLAKLRRSDEIAKRVLRAVIEKLSSPVSLNSISKEFEIKSHKTVFHYLNLFENLYVLKNVYYTDPNKVLEVYSKERKIHLTDPFLYTVFSDWCLITPPEKAKVVESVVASHLARKYRVGYWRGNFEIDVVVLDGPLGFEVKWREKTEYRRRMVGKIKKVMYLTKEEFNDSPVAVPVSVFLGCLKV